MPDVAKVVSAFKRLYGDKKGEQVYYASKNKEPEKFKKALKTAKKKGDKIIKHKKK